MTGEKIEGKIVLVTPVFLRIQTFQVIETQEYLTDNIANYTKNGKTTVFNEIDEPKKVKKSSVLINQKTIDEVRAKTEPRVLLQDEIIFEKDTIFEDGSIIEEVKIYTTVEESEKIDYPERNIVKEIVEEEYVLVDSGNVFVPNQQNNVSVTVSMDVIEESQENVDPVVAPIRSRIGVENAPSLSLLDASELAEDQFHSSSNTFAGNIEITDDTIRNYIIKYLSHGIEEKNNDLIQFLKENWILTAIITLVLLFIALVLLRKKRAKSAEEEIEVLETIPSSKPSLTPGEQKPISGPTYGIPPTPTPPASSGSPSYGMPEEKPQSQPQQAQPFEDPGVQDLNKSTAKTETTKEVSRRDQVGYWRHVPKIFIYPFKKGIFSATIGLTIIFSIMNIAMYAPFYGTIVIFMFGCYTAACMVKIIYVTVTDEREYYFDWPDFLDFFDWLGTAIIWVIASIISYLPAGLYIWKFHRFDAGAIVLLIIAAYIGPMYTLSIALVGGFSSLNPLPILKSIFKTFLPYTLTLLLLIFVGTLNFYVNLIPLIHIPFWGGLFKWFTFVYFIFLNMRILGTFYRCHNTKLQWCGEEEGDKK